MFLSLQVYLMCAFMCTENKPVEKCKKSAPRGRVAEYRTMFLFVNDAQPDPKQNSGIRRVNPGTTNCPWTWDTSIDSTRKPMVIATAKCENCDMNKCRKIVYNHKVLKQHKDCKTGDLVWEWEFEAFPIAFVYDV